MATTKRFKNKEKQSNENEVEFEYWFRADVPRKGAAEIQHMFELSFGLPYRFQLDLYGIARTEGKEKTFFDQAIELRYAFADWGKIWGNPALYIEYINRDQLPDKVEGKLLLGGQLATRWHWGSNFVFEHELGGAQENSHEWTTGLSYTARDRQLPAPTDQIIYGHSDVTGTAWLTQTVDTRSLPPAW